MAGLKLHGYIILLSTGLISRLGTELCFYNGIMDIADNTFSNEPFHRCEIDHNKNEGNHKDE